MDALPERKRILIFLSLTAVWMLVILFVAQEYVPSNPLRPENPLLFRSAFRQVFPEGWGFFTKSQRDEDFQIYRASAGASSALVFHGPESEPRNFIGLSRLPRAEGLEIGRMAAAIGVHFTACTGQQSECVTTMRRLRAKVISAAIGAPPLFCGDYLLAMQAPIPFAWASFPTVTRSGKYARIRIDCSAARKAS